MASEDTEPQTTDSQPNGGEQPDEGSDGSSSSLPETQPVQKGPPPLTIPVHAMKEIKAKAQQKGRAEAAEELARKFQPLLGLFGASSLDELEDLDLEEVLAERLEARKKVASKPMEPEEKKPVKPNPPQKVEDKAHKAMLQKQAAANRAAARAHRKAERLQAQLAASEAERDLREEAIRAGVQDVDYALTLLKRDLQRTCKTDDDFAAYDTGEFFQQLRKGKPYLWQAETEPATTGVDTAAEGGNGGAPAPSGSNGSGSEDSSSATPRDAMKASADEYQAMLRELGLNP
jgi:hypothetical protein